MKYFINFAWFCLTIYCYIHGSIISFAYSNSFYDDITRLYLNCGLNILFIFIQIVFFISNRENLFKEIYTKVDKPINPLWRIVIGIICVSLCLFSVILLPIESEGGKSFSVQEAPFFVLLFNTGFLYFIYFFRRSIFVKEYKKLNIKKVSEEKK